MIKSISLKPYTTICNMPDYVNRVVRMLATRGIMAGEHCESVAAKITMEKAGIKFDSDTSCHFLDLLNAVRERYHAINPEIEDS